MVASGPMLKALRLDQLCVDMGPDGKVTGTKCPQPNKIVYEYRLPHIRVDDWVFGVSSVSKDGFESPVASAVPGGAFKPWVKPAEPVK